MKKREKKMTNYEKFIKFVKDTPLFRRNIHKEYGLIAKYNEKDFIKFIEERFSEYTNRKEYSKIFFMLHGLNGYEKYHLKQIAEKYNMSVYKITKIRNKIYKFILRSNIIISVISDISYELKTKYYKEFSILKGKYFKYEGKTCELVEITENYCYFLFRDNPTYYPELIRYASVDFYNKEFKKFKRLKMKKEK